MKRHLPVVTQSEIRCARRCAREHHYAYGLGYRAVVEPEAFRFGSLIHTGLEAWWRAPDGRRLEDAIDALGAVAPDPFDLVRAGVITQGYDARWAEAAAAVDVVAVEPEFRASLRNPETGRASRTYELAGKLDVVIREHGQLKLMEHKTSSEDIGPGTAYWKRLTLDPQISIYFDGARALGHDITECVYDVIGKPALRPLKATPEADRKYTRDHRLYANQRAHDETPEEFRARLTEHIAENPHRYYQRGTVVRLEQEELDSAYDVWQTVQLIHEAALAGRHPRNPDSCQRYGRTCTYFDVCCGTASLDDPTRFVRVENVHSELTEAA